MPTTPRHTFLAGVDTDSADASLAPNAARALLNIAVERGRVTNAWGNAAQAIDLPAGRNKTVGSFADADTGTEVILVWNERQQHGLYRYDPATRASTLLLTWPGLNLAENHYVTGGGIIAEHFGYLDKDGVPRLLNLSRAAAGEYTAQLLADDPHGLDMARPTPGFAPVLTRQLNNSFSDPYPALRLTHDHTWQVAYRFAYLDDEVTPLSPFSEVLPSYLVYEQAPGTTSVTNCVHISIPATQPLSGFIQYIEVYVRKDSSLVWHLAHTIRRGTDGSFTRAYDYYGNTLGAPLAEPEAVKQREAVPLRCRAMVAADNRFILADILEGYAVPARIGLQVGYTQTAGDAAVPVQQTFKSGGLYTTGIQFEDDAGRTCGAVTLAPLRMPIQPAGFPRAQSLNQIAWSLPTTDPAQLNEEIPVWATRWKLVKGKERSRSFFYQTRAADMLVFSESYYDATAPRLNRLWLYGGNTTRSITNPVWAKLQTRVFVDIGNLVDSTEGQVGYTFKPGSNDRIWFPEEGMDLPINGQSGDYLEVIWTRRTGPASTMPLIEIYSPASVTEEDPLYETGPTYPVIRTTGPNGQERRSYGVTSGLMEPDCFLRQELSTAILTEAGADGGTGDDSLYTLKPPRKKLYTGVLIRSYESLFTLQDIFGQKPNWNNFIVSWQNFAVAREKISAYAHLAHPLYLLVESMNPQVATYALWLHGRTRPTAARLEGQAERGATMRFTGALIPGTHVNGLGTMDALNEKNLAREQGRVKSLKLADQTQAEGTVLLAIQERGTESFYLGQAQLAQAAGQPLLAISDQVLSPGTPLSKGLGTAHPESVVHFDGTVWFWDALRREVVRYNRNGTTPLSSEHNYLSRCRELAEAHAGAPVTGYYDPARREYLLTFGATQATPAETIGFSERVNGFVDRYSFTPEWGTHAGNQLLTFRGGIAHVHDPSLPRNTFYGELFPSLATLVVGADQSQVEKTWTGIVIEATSRWVPTQLRNAAGQMSRMLPAWLTRHRTTWQGSIRRNYRTIGLAEARALHEGEKLQSPLLTIVLRHEGTEATELVALELSYSVNAGQFVGPTG